MLFWVNEVSQKLVTFIVGYTVSGPLRNVQCSQRNYCLGLPLSAIPWFSRLASMPDKRARSRPPQETLETPAHNTHCWSGAGVVDKMEGHLKNPVTTDSKSAESTH